VHQEPVRTIPLSFFALVFGVLGLRTAYAQEIGVKKPPVGVPQDAQLFAGKWYHLYLERVQWRHARDKCKRLGGQLAIIPDQPTDTFLRSLAGGLTVWLGATDEKVESLWVWVDGSKMTYKAWAETEPGNAHGREHFLVLYGKDGALARRASRCRESSATSASGRTADPVRPGICDVALSPPPPPCGARGRSLQSMR
jgi:hypothetical protein